MKEIPVQRARELAAGWADSGRSWHFHALTPGCVLNERKDQYALVLENRTDDETWIVHSDDEHVQLSQDLVKMLHGDAILDKERAAASPEHAELAWVLRRLATLNDAGVAWHHHMLFPDCIFNHHPGHWTLAIEIEEEPAAKTLELVYDQEPVDDLRQVEVLYFSQVDSDF